MQKAMYLVSASLIRVILSSRLLLGFSSERFPRVSLTKILFAFLLFPIQRHVQPTAVPMAVNGRKDV
jgi:hypothetical protein